MGLALAALVCACSSTETSQYPCPDHLVCDDSGAADHGPAADQGAAGDQGGADGGSEPKGWVGTPCEKDDDCGAAGRKCVNETLLKSFNVEGMAVPGGMCSKLACMKDEDCGEGGTCFDTKPFTGTPIKICLQLCKDLAECRWGEAYVCHPLPEGDGGACLPSSISVAIICDDGHCEEAE
jgi:hypothetical protein